MALRREELSEGKNEGYWRRHHEAWKESKLKQAQYCRKHALNYKSFLYWKKKLDLPTKGAALIPVCIRSEVEDGQESKSTAISLKIGNRYWI